MGVDPGALNLMAIAGKRPIDGCDKDPMKQRPCYYSASDATKFGKAIDGIIGGLAGTSVIAACDDTCFSLGCPADYVCVYPKTCAGTPECQRDPCAGVP